MPNVLPDIFGKSPVIPLEKHIAQAHDCADGLKALFSAATDRDWDRARAARTDILEHKRSADEIKQEIRLNLPRSLFMPVSREDLLRLLSAQDQIVDLSRRIAADVVARELALPKTLANDYVAFLHRAIDAVAQARKSMEELDELFTTGFRGAEAKLVEAMIRELDAIGSAVRHQHFDLQVALKSAEDALSPVDTLFLYKTLENTGGLAVAAERVGHRLEMLLSR